LSPVLDRCPRWEWQRGGPYWRGRPCSGRGCGQGGLGRAEKLAARLARTQDVEAEFFNSQTLVHLCRPSSTLPLPRQQPSIGVLWTAALELVPSSPLAGVHSTLQGAPTLTLSPSTSLPGRAAGVRFVPGRPIAPPHPSRWPPYVSLCWSLRCWVWRSWQPPATPWLLSCQEPPSMVPFQEASPTRGACDTILPVSVTSSGAPSVLSFASRRRGRIQCSSRPAPQLPTAEEERTRRSALVDAGSGAGGRCFSLVLTAKGAVRCSLPACGSSFLFAL